MANCLSAKTTARKSKGFSWFNACARRGHFLILPRASTGALLRVEEESQGTYLLELVDGLAAGFFGSLDALLEEVHVQAPPLDALPHF
jgi:hypothetical protein